MIGLYALALVPLFAVLNRAAGRDEWFPGRNIYGVIILAFTITYLMFDAYVATAIALSWATYRLPGWYALLDMGRNNAKYYERPQQEVARDFLLMIPRQLFYFPIFYYAYRFHDVDPVLAGGLWVLTGILGACGYLVGHLAWLKTIEDKTKPLSGVNPGVVAELAAGAGLGLGTACILLQIY